MMVFFPSSQGTNPVSITRTIEPFENQLTLRGLIDKLWSRRFLLNFKKNQGS